MRTWMSRRMVEVMPRYRPLMPCFFRMLTAQSTEPLYDSRPCRVAETQAGSCELIWGLPQGWQP